MAQQQINVGTAANDGTGDSLRLSQQKANANFTELYNNKVDKISGKGLSTNDFTTLEQTKLLGIEENAQVNVQADWNETDPLADSYINGKPTFTTYVPSITQSFTYAGGAQVFTLSYAPNNVDVYVNHVWQIPTTDATLSGADVTVISTLTIGDVVTVRPFGAANLPEQFTATSGQTVFTLSVTPNNVDVHSNRVWQIPITDYTLSGNLLTLSEPATAGDIITLRPF